MSMKSNHQTSAFAEECAHRISGYASDEAWRKISHDWMCRAFEQKYMYNFAWMGRPIIQTPIDIVAMHELIWTIKPDLIIETGIAHGGSLVMSASMLALLDYCDSVETGSMLDPMAAHRRVVGIDIDIRADNRAAIAGHPMAHRIDMIQGSSIDSDVIAQVRELARGFRNTLICLDSNHTHEHVLAELEAYAPLVSPGSYCVVFDTIVDDLPDGTFPNRPWRRGDNPKTAVREYLRRVKEEGRKGANGASLVFEIDKSFEDKLVITVAPDGYLKRMA